MIVLVWFASRSFNHPTIGIDDANIFFTYAENLVAGHGLVYNAGGEKVEGFTSLLWVFISAGLFKMRFNEIGVLTTSIIFLVVAQLAILRVIRHGGKGNGTSLPYEISYLFLICSSPAYITWMSVTLMDTCLWGTAIALMATTVLVPPRSTAGKISATLLFSLTMLVRPEAMVVTFAFIILLGLRLYTLGRVQEYGFVLGCLGGVTLTLLLLTLFRVLYFGYPLPNTYYAKVSPSLQYNMRTGLEYLFGYVRSSPVVVFGFAGTVLILLRWIFSAVRSFWKISEKGKWYVDLSGRDLAALTTFMLLLIPVLTGGDHFALYRFYQPVFPLLCLTIVLWAQKIGLLDGLILLRTDKRQKRYWVQSALVIICSLYFIWGYVYERNWKNFSTENPLQKEFVLVDYGVNWGKSLNTLFAGYNPKPAIGVIVAGSVARVYDGPVVDLMGLNNTLMAHSKGSRKGIKNHAAFNPEIFYRINPEILLVTPYSVFSRKALKDIFMESQFRRRYVFGTLQLKGKPEGGIKVFFAKAFVEKISRYPRFVFYDDTRW